MQLFFTPVNGKRALINRWSEVKLTEEEARKQKNLTLEITGLGLVHSLSKTVAFDFDDWDWCVKKFQEVDVDIAKVIEGHYEIVSPKANTRKIVFQQPTTPVSHTVIGGKLELRCGNHYDVWPGSLYPGGKSYSHAGSDTILPLPDILLEFWQACQQHKQTDKKAGNGYVPLIYNDKLSTIHVYNLTHSLEDVLQQCGYDRRGNHWRSPNSESGAYGINLQPSYLNPWMMCFSHHASDGDLSLRPLDAFEIAAKFAHPNMELAKAKAVFVAEQAKRLKAIDPETGEIMKTTIHEYNNPSDLHATVDELTTKEQDPPEFYEGILNSLPEPIPLLLKNFKECIYDPIPSMYGPAFMAMHEVLLRGRVRTIRDRSVNCNYANGSVSGGGKDANSVEAALRYAVEFDRARRVNTTPALDTAKHLLSPITSLFTSGNNLLQAMHRTKLTETDAEPFGGVFMNAEATAFYRNIADSNNHFMGKAIMDVEVGCFNGILVSGSRVTSDSKKHFEDIKHPNYSFYRLTQLEPFKNAFNIDTIISGYYGRLFETYDTRTNVEPELSSTTNQRDFKFNPVGFEFLNYLAIQIAELKQDIQVKCNLPGGEIAKWEKRVLIQGIYPKIDPELYAGMRRIPQMAEKWVATATAFNYFWRKFNNDDTHDIVLERNENQVVTLNGKEFESSVVPMMDYLAEVKLFSIHNFILNSEASKYDAMLERLWKSCVETPPAKSKVYGEWLNEGKVPYVMFADKVKKSKECSRNPSFIVDRAISTWLKNKGLMITPSAVTAGKNRKKKTCIVEVI